VAGLESFAEAGVDFLEINESCPNTEQGPVTASDLAQRLAALSRRFLARRSRPLPVVVKFSCDTDPRQVPELVRMLVAEGFDGVNFGNTSQRYGELRPAIAPSERRLYDLFSARFGGGVSGRPLKEVSLALASAAVAAAAREGAPGRAQESAQESAQERGQAEFHVIRTGGVETAADVRASEAAGVSLNGWYTGYYEAFGRRGHGLYEAILEELSREKS
jgi:dihydroorotate dehydrogenase